MYAFVTFKAYAKHGVNFSEGDANVIIDTDITTFRQYFLEALNKKYGDECRDVVFTSMTKLTEEEYNMLQGIK